MALHSLISLFLLLTLGLCSDFVVRRGGHSSAELATQAVAVHEAYPFPPVSAKDDIELLDIMLVASVDGKLHGLSRSSGRIVWSMASTENDPSTLGPLVTTQHPDIDYDATDEDSVHQEVYVIEPQSGDIYVMSSPGSPLQRLPFSMSQLVDMSPYSIEDDDYRRNFVGKKETSLLLIELETGKVKATINSECPWDPYEEPELALDLDELDGTKPSRRDLKPPEVFIGRTDYHISIYTRPLSPSSPRPPVHNLSFSTYGPNNQDFGLQSLYRYTADNTYLQPLPNGKVFAFRSNSLDRRKVGPFPDPLWAQAFHSPIVAVFDVLREPHRQHPFVLLQPRRSLEEMLPTTELAARAFPFADSAYVGLVPESGSLFAMAPDMYPLVVFGDAESHAPSDAGPARAQERLPPALELWRSMARGREREHCESEPGSLYCLTGVRKLESSSQSRLIRLLDSVPAVHSPTRESVKDRDVKGMSFPDNVSVHRQDVPRLDGGPAVHAGWAGVSEATVGSVGLALFVIALSVGYVKGFFGKAPGRWKTAEEPVDPVVSTPQLAVEDTAANPEANGRATSAPNDSILPAEPKPSFLEKASSSIFGPDKVDGLATNSLDHADDNADGDNSEGEGEVPGKRKAVRRKRGKKKKGSAAAYGIESETKEQAEAKEAAADVDVKDGADEAGDGFVHVVSPSAAVVPPPAPSQAGAPSLVVSDTVLGYGSHGTVVYKGSLQGRAVAVKRLLQDFVTLASREVAILQESDDHPNVIRYYYQESHANFLYIALELCPASLADVVERPDAFPDIACAFEPKRALRQVTAGLRHLHALKIVHRDIKPQNILISGARGSGASQRMLISDFGLCKKLELDQTSFLPTAHGAMAAGTVGWRAPEILRGEVKLDDTASDESQSSRGSVGTATGPTSTTKPTRLTKSVDIFALGCLYYYVLTNGTHPFGDRYEREINIMRDAKALDGLERFGEEGAEGADLISQMLDPNACNRPDTSTCLLHPYFWDPGKRLTFLQDASDRFEIMCRDPRDPNLITLETGAADVVGNDWHARLDKLFIENLGKFRKYDGKSVQDLLRALRNKKHHYQDLPDNVKRLLGSMPEGFLAYFTRRFPNLFLHVHSVISDSPMRNESMFRSYFNLAD